MYNVHVIQLSSTQKKTQARMWSGVHLIMQLRWGVGRQLVYLKWRNGDKISSAYLLQHSIYSRIVSQQHFGEIYERRGKRG